MFGFTQAQVKLHDENQAKLTKALDESKAKNADNWPDTLLFSAEGKYLRKF